MITMPVYYTEEVAGGTYAEVLQPYGISLQRVKEVIIFNIKGDK